MNSTGVGSNKQISVLWKGEGRTETFPTASRLRKSYLLLEAPTRWPATLLKCQENLNCKEQSEELTLHSCLRFVTRILPFKIPSSAPLKILLLKCTISEKPDLPLPHCWGDEGPTIKQGNNFQLRIQSDSKESKSGG